jgi:hypothetical protein
MNQLTDFKSFLFNWKHFKAEARVTLKAAHPGALGTITPAVSCRTVNLLPSGDQPDSEDN